MLLSAPLESFAEIVVMGASSSGHRNQVGSHRLSGQPPDLIEAAPTLEGGLVLAGRWHRGGPPILYTSSPLRPGSCRGAGSSGTAEGLGRSAAAAAGPSG
jgi:hypothetical protein